MPCARTDSMMANAMESRSRVAALNSCDFCREKKYKCSQDRPSCQRCVKHNRVCHYSAQITRSPLTRVYLTSVECRVRKLEQIFARLHPDLHLEDALSSPENASSSEVITPSTDFGFNFAQEVNPDVVHSEALPLVATGFEWQEINTTIDDLADGMASLSVDPSGKGYLGSTSGAGLLRSLLPDRPGISPQMYNGQFATSFLQSQNDLVLNSRVAGEVLNHQVVGFLLDSYFSNYHVSYPFIHEPSFRAAYSEIVPRPPLLVWSILFYTILALGAWTISDDSDGLDDLCYQKVVSSFGQQSVFEIGSLPLVQALVLLSNYVQKRNKPNTGSNYLGLVTRMALSLGLHRELPEWKISFLEREQRRRVWWGLFIFDSGASMTFGRPILLPDHLDVKSVLNIPDESLTPTTTTMPLEIATPTIYSSLIWQTSFHVVSNPIANRLLVRPALSAKEALELNGVLKSWTLSLPAFFNLNISPNITPDWYIFARSKLSWRCWNLQILLMRPFILRWTFKATRQPDMQDESNQEAQCRGICVFYAHKTILSINEYLVTNTLTRLSGWYALFFLFHATLIPLLCLRTSPESEDAVTWREDINTTKIMLELSFANFALGRKCLAVLNQLSATEAGLSFSERDLNFDDSDLWAQESWMNWPDIQTGMPRPNFGPPT